MSRTTANRGFAPEVRANKGISDKQQLDELLQGILSKQDKVRYPSFKALMAMAEDQPEILYPHWDYIAALLKRENTHSKYIGIHLLARLTVVDKDDKFKAVFAGYYDLLDDKSVISAAHVAGNSGRIAKAKPELEARITERLLGIDKPVTSQVTEN